jgi:hypothetical protein
VLIDGRLERKLATPLEYLDRLALQNAVFLDDFRVEGVNVSDKPSLILFEQPGQPSFVVSQEWIIAADAEHPTPSPDEICVYMGEAGFEDIPEAYYGWWRREDGVLIVDAKPDNFLKTERGITPIDLQMSSVAPQQIPAAREAPEPSLIWIPRDSK